MPQPDLVIRNGKIADGTGAPLFEGDVAITGGRIAGIGRIDAAGREEIDATGKLVTPGFVDIHTHYDGQAVWDDRLAPSSVHGVTTAVMGNCGVGFAPVRPTDHLKLIELMEGVEDIPGAALHEGLDFRWESFDDYLGVLERRPRDIDLCAQLPHGPLRVYVMGERAVRREEATADDVAAMRVLTAEAISAGALGFTTTRSLNHRTATGDYTPTLRAAAEELKGIALGLKDANAGVLQVISDFDTPSLEVEFAMLRELVEISGRPLSISVAQRHTQPGHWREIMALVDQAVDDGLPMRAQVAPRPIGVLLGLQSSRNPFSFTPAYAEIQDLPLAERVARMREPAFRARLLDEIEAPQRGYKKRVTEWPLIFPFGDPPDYSPPAEMRISAIAEREGRAPGAVALDLMLQNEGRGFIYAPFANYADHNLDVCREMLTRPNTLPGLSDGGAHVRLISDGSFPTYMLSHWGRDRTTGRLDIPWLIKRQTADTAAAVSLNDRGRLAPGLKADVNVIDMDRLALHAPLMASDLPAGGSRLLQGADGYVATICSGQVIYREGQATGALPGKLVRGPQV